MSSPWLLQGLSEYMPFAPPFPLHNHYIRIVHQYGLFFGHALMHSNVNNIGGGRGRRKKREGLRDFARIT